MLRRGLLCCAAVLLAWGTGACPAAQANAPTKQAHVAVFDFHCPGDEAYGKKLADAIRMRLARHPELDVIDRLTTGEFCPPLPAETESAKVARIMSERLAANLGVYGTVRKNAASVHLELCGVDLRGGGKPKVWQKEFRDATQRPEAVISKAAAEAITGQAEWVPPQYGDEEEPKDFGKPLNVNGSFDDGHPGWQRPDNVASFLEKGPAGRGTVLRIRTDLERWPYINYVRAIRMGSASAANPPKIGRDTSYGSLAGMEGVHFKSDWVRATPGQRYWLTADFDHPGAKVFLKGFRKTEHALDGLPESALARYRLTPQQFAELPEKRRKELVAKAAASYPELFYREVYRWYLNCRGEGGRWNHLAAPVPPRGGLPDNVEWLQVQVYAYWPPGTYRFDNVHLYKDPRQKAPLPEEKPRTPNFGKTSDVVEKETAERERKPGLR